MAGVSAGTVDRVLHKRGRVSDDAMQKVSHALKKIDYQPNLIARSLASKKTFCIIACIPSFKPGEYWEEVSKGIDAVEREFADFHLQVERIFFDQYDRDSFDQAAKKLTSASFQGAIIAPLFKDSVYKLTQKMDVKKIPYLFIDSYIQDTNCLAYFGIDSYRSGHISGRLLFEKILPDDNILLFHLITKGSIESTQVSMREKGFRDYLATTGFTGKIFPLSVSSESPEDNTKQLDAFLQKAPSVKAGIIFNSRIHIVAPYFIDRQLADFFLIGYDAIQANIDFLKNGIVSHLIAQRPEVQGYNSVKAIFQHLAFNLNIEKVNFMPIDILIKENIEYYNNYI